MKRIKNATLFISLALMLSAMLPSCEKESVSTHHVANVQEQDGILLNYLVNGKQYSSAIEDEAKLKVMLGNLIETAKEGQCVTILPDGSSVLMATDNNEPIVFQTSSEQEALAWTREMLHRGYEVNITYDRRTQIYTCVATPPNSQNEANEPEAQ